MALDPVSLGLGIAGSAVKGITGAFQYAKGNKLLKGAERPTYEIPEEILKNLSIAERQALQGLPEAQKRQYVENLDRQAGSVLSGFTSRKAGLTGITNFARTQSDAYKDLLSQDAMARQQNELAAMNMRNIMASYRDKAFEFNKVQPYEQQVAEGQALVGAGMQNVFGGLDEAAGTALMSGMSGDGRSGDMVNENSGIDPRILQLLSQQVNQSWQKQYQNQLSGTGY